MKRRSLLVMATLAGGGLVAGCASPARQQLRGSAMAAQAGQVALNGWVKVGTDGMVTAVVGKSEMGQGVHTALMMLVAEEMDCAWAQMRLEQSPVDPLYGNVAALADGVPFRGDDTGVAARSVRWVMTTLVRQFGFMMTGGSSSIRDLWLPMRQAAATTRATLVEAVALQWQVAPADVRVNDGVFTGPKGRSLGLAEAVRLLGPAPRPAAQVHLKDPAQFRLIGQPVRRTEAVAKTEGSAAFGIDVRPPGLLYAAVRLAPVRGGRVKSFDATQARALAGVVGVVSFEPAHGGSGGVAVVADGWWRATQALEAVQVQFDDGPLAGFSSSEATNLLARKLDTDDGFAYWKVGNARAAIQASQRQLQAEYRAPYLAHATMEPMNCTVQFNGDSATVWAPTQVPGFARRAAARALGLGERQVEMQVTYLGGGFGRRLEVDVVAQAATVARQFPGRPVQLLWSREDDLRHDFYRPACVARLAAGLDRRGQVAAWQQVSAGQAVVPAYMPRNAGLPVFGPDKSTAEGAFDPSYEFPVVRVGHVTVDLPVPVGFWRSVGHSHQAFFKECFLDECAHVAGADPLAYRRALLARHPRQRAVLDLVAARSGWGTALPPAADGAKRARGVALHESFGSTVAQVAEVSVGPDGAIRVHRVTCAIDCGIPVNPATIAQQMEGGVVFGLAAALHGRIDIDQGRVQQGNFHEYAALRMAECPVIETHIVPSARPPEGVGEPGVPPIAPAVANAVFALTGKRLRSLPLALAS